MKCPACGREMKQTTVKDLVVDVCEGGCGGLWFDWLELKKVDEVHEAAGADLLDVTRDPGVTTDHEAKRDCPRCEGVTMMRHFTSVQRDVAADECAKCGGVFLDHGELNSLRSEYPTESERDEAARALFAEMFDGELDDLAADSEDAVSRSRGLAHMFRFLLPSYWLPGKQPWGAY